METVIERESLIYCLYARKSTESDEKQTMSIESQVKEMLVSWELSWIFLIKRDCMKYEPTVRNLRITQVRNFS